MDSIMKQEIMDTPELLKRTAENARTVVRKIAGMIEVRGIRRIFLAARGSSANAAAYFKYLCEVLTGIPVVELSPSVFTIYGASVDMTGGIVIAISQGGRGIDIRYPVEAAAIQEVPTVAVTNFGDSPLAALCDTILPLSIGVERSMAATKSFTAELLVLNMLACALAGVPGGAEYAPAAFAKGLEKEPEIVRYLDIYKDGGVIHVLGRGKLLALAREMCCKVQETCLINAFPFSAADFMHGPFALVEPGSRAVLFHSKYAATKSTLDMFDSLAGQNADILLITDDPDFPGESGKTICVDSASEEESVFAMTAVLQLFAANLAQIRGTDPDKSRNLSKYTETL